MSPGGGGGGGSVARRGPPATSPGLGTDSQWGPGRKDVAEHRTGHGRDRRTQRRAPALLPNRAGASGGGRRPPAAGEWGAERGWGPPPRVLLWAGGRPFSLLFLPSGRSCSTSTRCSCGTATPRPLPTPWPDWGGWGGLLRRRRRKNRRAARLRMRASWSCRRVVRGLWGCGVPGSVPTGWGLLHRRGSPSRWGASLSRWGASLPEGEEDELDGYSKSVPGRRRISKVRDAGSPPDTHQEG